MNQVRFLEAAELELADSSEYYEPQADGLGFVFLQEVENAVSSIVERPNAWTFF